MTSDRELAQSYQDMGFFIVEPKDPIFLDLVSKAYERSVALADKTGNRIERKWTHATGKVKHLVNPHRTEPVFSELLNSPPVLGMVRQVFGVAPVYVTHSKISYKVSGIEQIWLPHQDSAYKPMGHSEGMTIAVFLEDCDEHNGTLELYPKSNSLGRLAHEVLFVQNETEPQIRVMNEPSITPIPISARQGSLLGMHCNTIHRSGENRSGGLRSIFIFEVEKIRRFALESDGMDAVILNQTSGDSRRSLLMPVTKMGLYFLERWVKPQVKKAVFIGYKILKREKFVKVTTKDGL